MSNLIWSAVINSTIINDICIHIGWRNITCKLQQLMVLFAQAVDEFYLKSEHNWIESWTWDAIISLTLTASYGSIVCIFSSFFLISIYLNRLIGGLISMINSVFTFNIFSSWFQDGKPLEGEMELRAGTCCFWLTRC